MARQSSTSATLRIPARVRSYLVVAGIALLGLGVLVGLAIWLRSLPGVQSFLASYPGTAPLPESAPVGIPAWLAWQHGLNAFLIVFIIRSGWQIRTTTRPPGYWTRKNTGPLRTKSKPSKINLLVWWHVVLDSLWVLNGIVFIVLLFLTGQWMRVVPTSWEVVPNALSAGLQYLSLDWPHENGWVNYNSLQVLAYFATIFLAAPLALITGLRMSPLWKSGWTRVNRAYPIELARAVHFPVMLYVVGFIVVHVTLVFATGALRNLNHMYAAQDSDGVLGLVFFAVSVLVMVGVWLATGPTIIRSIAQLTGTVTRG